MGRSQNAFIKKQKAEQKRKKKLAKKEKMEARKTEDSSGKLEDMMAFVDEYGNITTDPDKEATRVTVEKHKRNVSQRRKRD